MRRDRRHGKDLTVGSIPRHLILFSLPMLIGGLLQTAYAFINAIWVGKFLGTAALAAVTVSFPIVFALIALGSGLTLATNILVSQNYGAKNFAQVRRVIDSSTALIYCLSIALFIVGELFTPGILRAIDTPADVLPLASRYLQIYLIALPLGFGLFLTRNSLQGIGDSRTPLYFQGASVILTAALDPLLMFGWCGFPRLGLNGTAWAAVAGHLFALGGLVWYLRRTQSLVAPRLRHLEFDWPTALTTIRVGLPSAAQQSLVSIGLVFVTGIVNSFGQTATAAFGAASRIDQFAFMPAMSIGMAIASLSGQNIGAKKHDRVREIFFWGCALSGGITLCASIVALSMPSLLLRIFINDPQVIALGVQYLHVVAGAYVFFAVTFVCNGIINGAGHTLVTTLISLLSLWIIRVPCAYYLSHRIGNVSGVWYAMALSFGVTTCTSTAYYLSGRWQRVRWNKKDPKPEFEAPALETAST